MPGTPRPEPEERAPEQEIVLDDDVSVGTRGDEVVGESLIEVTPDGGVMVDDVSEKAETIAPTTWTICIPPGKLYDVGITIYGVVTALPGFLALKVPDQHVNIVLLSQSRQGFTFRITLLRQKEETPAAYNQRKQTMSDWFFERGLELMVAQ